MIMAAIPTALTSCLTLGNVLMALLAMCLLVYWYCTRDFGKYEALGLPQYEPPKFFFGNNKDLMMTTKHTQDHVKDLYKKFTGKSCGVVYEGFEACIFLRDLDLIKQVTIKDFDHFTDFGFSSELLNKLPINDLGLGAASGERWRSLKYTVAPAFSLRNLKNATSALDEMALNVVDAIKKKMSGGDNKIDIEVSTGHFAMDCIARLVFSMDLKAAQNPENEFLKKGENFLQAWRFILASLFPQIMYLFNIAFFNPESIKYFSEVAKKMLNDRDSAGKGQEYTDVLGVMMKSRNIESTLSDDLGEHMKGTRKCNLDNDTIAKTLMQFFLDGYDTVTIAISWCFYFMALHPDVQEKARDEVDKVAQKHGDHLKGDEASELKYLDQVFNEASRMAPFPTTWRRCTKDWVLPGYNIPIKKGTRLQIPIAGMHMDPELFEDPETFDPDRFGPERKFEIKSGSFLPFGIGPRQCMGMKIAQLEAKVLMFHILRNFKLETCEKTTVPIEWGIEGLNRLKGGTWLKMVPR